MNTQSNNFHETSIRAKRLIELCLKNGMSREEAIESIASTLADKQDQVHISKSDLKGLILNIFENFNDEKA